ncbi:protein of unknown function [Streptomyces murinus]
MEAAPTISDKWLQPASPLFVDRRIDYRDIRPSTFVTAAACHWHRPDCR